MGFFDDLIEAGIQLAANKVKNVIKDTLTEQNLETCTCIGFTFEYSTPGVFSDQEMRNTILNYLANDLANLINVSINEYNTALLRDSGYWEAFVLTNGEIVIKFGLYGMGQCALCVSGENCGKLVDSISSILEELKFSVDNPILNEEPPFHEAKWLNNAALRLKKFHPENQENEKNNSNESNESDSIHKNIDAPIVSEWNSDTTENGIKLSIFFHNNNTFSMEVVIKSMQLDYVSGTYSGDTTKDGIITILTQYVSDEDDFEKRITEFFESETPKELLWKWKKQNHKANIKISGEELEFFNCDDVFDLSGIIFYKSKKPSIISKWSHEREDGCGSNFYFFSDNTQYAESVFGNMKRGSFYGMYFGNPTQNGTVKIKITKKKNHNTGEWEPDEGETDVKINGKSLLLFKFDGNGVTEYTNKYGCPDELIEESFTPEKQQNEPQNKNQPKSPNQQNLDMKTQIENVYRKTAKKIGNKATLISLGFEHTEKLAQIAKGYAKNASADERPLLIYDNSTFENCKSGFFITDKTIYAKNSFSLSNVQIDISTVKDFTFQKTLLQKSINFNDKEIETEQIGGEGTERLFDLVKFIIGKIRKGCDFSSIPTIQELFGTN